MTPKKGPFTSTTRLALQVTAASVALIVLAIPPLLVVFSGTASLDATWTALRIAALEAYSLIFLNIVTGSLRPLFNRIFKARTVQRAHVATGLAGFSLALAHGILASTYGITGFNTSAVSIGPVMLIVLTVVILSALARRRMRGIWRWIHRLNYLLFAAIFIHAFVLGYDLKSEALLRGLFIAYAVVVATGLTYRLSTLRKTNARVSGGSRFQT